MLIRGKIQEQNSDSVEMIEEVMALVRERGVDPIYVISRMFYVRTEYRSPL